MVPSGAAGAEAGPRLGVTINELFRGMVPIAGPTV
jgi:hypothetical protein